MRTFVIGDIHGAYRALIQCLNKANFDYQQDTLICLGDVCDGWSETNLCFDELLKIKNLICILGNHDDWTLKWVEKGEKSEDWLAQGGQATINCYPSLMPQNHIEILKNAYLYHINKNRLFVHGGFLLHHDLKKHNKETLIWDRSLSETAIYLYFAGINKKIIKNFDEVYIGHSPLCKYNIFNPIHSCGIWLMDTGAGWWGVLSIMNIETKEYWTSDYVMNLYPNEKGRLG